MPSASWFPINRAGRTPRADAVGAFLRAAVDGLLAVLVAPVCAACHQSLEAPTRGPVCTSCWNAIRPIVPPYCRGCGEPLPSWRAVSVAESRCARCRRIPSNISHVRAIGPYEGSLRAIVHALKYGGRQTIAGGLAARLRAHGTDVLTGADAIVPVPLHPSRERARGFNQARELGRHLEVPMMEALRRTRRTQVQADLPAARRHRNVRGAFSVRHPSEVGGLIVVLVDDVSTTGATLQACAAPLLDAGAREVRALIVARAATRQP